MDLQELKSKLISERKELAALAPCAVPGRMGEREVNPAVAARTAIELADELIKQLKGDKQWHQ